MGARVVAGVESAVESAAFAAAGGPSSRLEVWLLGPFGIQRDGQPVTLPPSRKLRALLAYLALASHELTRSALGELLWQRPHDPRGELRWCLSKLRTLLDEPGQRRVLGQGDRLRLDLTGCRIDAVLVARALQAGLGTLAAQPLRALAATLSRGEFLEGLELAHSPAFNAWVLAQQRRFHAAHTAVLEHLVRALMAGSDEAIAVLGQWLRLASFDLRAHRELLEALALAGRWQEGDSHLAATARLLEAEGQDWAALGRAWHAARRPRAEPGALPATVEVLPAVATPRRASLLVMPFEERGAAAAQRAGLGRALAHDIVAQLARLRCMFVIAQGTAVALDERGIDAEQAARRLDVDYVASGSLQRVAASRWHVGVQLVQTRSARVLWADSYDESTTEVFELLRRVGERIVASIAGQVELAERNRALLKPPQLLDAWEAHHRGLWHMVRFDRADNLQARHYFELALRLDPTFSRPYAGLSFTHFQDAFLGWAERDAAEEQAYRSASQALMVDADDPSAHWAMGRALWLRGRVDDALSELDTCVELSPNFALGHYMLAFVHAQSGDAQHAIRESDCSRQLSPFDPLLFGMLGSRAMALMRLRRYDEAAEWALKAAARPNAHVHIVAIAMLCLELAGRDAQAQELAARIARAQPGYRIDDFRHAFRFDALGRGLVDRAARRIGLP